MNAVTDGYRTEWTPQELAAEIAAVIRDHEALWYQGSWFGLGGGRPIESLRAALLEESPVCGTTACVAGWAAAFASPKGTKVWAGGSLEFPDGGGVDVMDVARCALGLSQADAGWLFDGIRTKDEVLEALDGIASGGGWTHYKKCDSCGHDL